MHQILFLRFFLPALIYFLKMSFDVFCRLSYDFSLFRSGVTLGSILSQCASFTMVSLKMSFPFQICMCCAQELRLNFLKIFVDRKARPEPVYPVIVITLETFLIKPLKVTAFILFQRHVSPVPISQLDRTCNSNRPHSRVRSGPAGFVILPCKYFSDLTTDYFIIH